MTNLIFRTTSPAALAWYADYTKRYAERHEQIVALTDEITAEFGPFAGKEHRNVYTINGVLIGVERTDEEMERKVNDKTFFEGWRQHQKYDIFVPLKTSKVGKAWQARLDAIPSLYVRNELDQIGMPGMAFGNGRMYQPGFTFDLDADENATALYVSYGSTNAAEDVAAQQARVPEVEWESMKLSEWHLREETKAEAEAAA